MHPVNLLPTSCGPLETFVAHSGRYKSTLDYILLPNCLFDGIISSLKGRGPKQTIKIIIGVLLCSPPFVKFMRWLEKHVVDEGLFSDTQFGFKEGVGCTEASFTILETINHMLERGSKVFGCFLDVRKAFDTVWIDGLLYLNLVLKGECGWLLKLCIRVPKHRFFTLAHYLEVFPQTESSYQRNKTNDLILNLTPENVTQHSRIE